MTFSTLGSVPRRFDLEAGVVAEEVVEDDDGVVVVVGDDDDLLLRRFDLATEVADGDDDLPPTVSAIAATAVSAGAGTAVSAIAATAVSAGAGTAGTVVREFKQ